MSRRLTVRLAMIGLGVALGGARRADAQTPARVVSLVPAPDTVSGAVIERIVESARSRGLPAEPLLAKVNEGRLKRASGARIAAAVAALAVRLDSASAALGSGATVAELIAGADAIAAGAPPSALRALRAATSMRPMSVPLGVLAQLLASGVPGPRAVSVVLELLRREIAPSRVLAFGNAVEGDAASGVPAEESALFRLRSMGLSGPGGATSALSEPSIMSPSSAKPPASSGPPRRRP